MPLRSAELARGGAGGGTRPRNAPVWLVADKAERSSLVPVVRGFVCVWLRVWYFSLVSRVDFSLFPGGRSFT